ncbi:molybdate ABC transporter substrate-binding protein [Tautonia plasticadhaerens]|nr:molybdate ABC transporter substrate-binding protein [Tautonia plasticadhaerens]
MGIGGVRGRVVPLLLVVLSGVILPGCRGPSADGPPPELHVAAASDLFGAMPELADAFERRTGVRVVPVLGSSGQLARQIEQGAPYDLFLSANLDYARRLADSGAIDPATVRPYAVGPLVLAFPATAGTGRSGLGALADPEVRSIALANPDHAPYGKAGKQVLERSGLWDSLESKVVYGQSIRVACRFVESGQADAGLIARSLADTPGIRWEPIDPALHDPIEQYLGVVAASDRRQTALAFCELLLGEEGRAILRRFGFEGLAGGDRSASGG